LMFENYACRWFAKWAQNCYEAVTIAICIRKNNTEMILIQVT